MAELNSQIEVSIPQYEDDIIALKQRIVQLENQHRENAVAIRLIFEGLETKFVEFQQGYDKLTKDALKEFIDDGVGMFGNIKDIPLHELPAMIKVPSPVGLPPGELPPLSEAQVAVKDVSVVDGKVIIDTKEPPVENAAEETEKVEEETPTT